MVVWTCEVSLLRVEHISIVRFHCYIYYWLATVIYYCKGFYPAKKIFLLTLYKIIRTPSHTPSLCSLPSQTRTKSPLLHSLTKTAPRSWPLTSLSTTGTSSPTFSRWSTSTISLGDTNSTKLRPT